MYRYIARRLVLMVPVLLGISVVVFLLIHLIPGDAAQILLGAEAGASEEKTNEVRRALGIDRPLPVQFADWFSHIITGDFGKSIRTGRPVLPDLIGRLGVTFQLTLAALFVSLVIAIPSGVVSALNQDRWPDFVSRLGSLLGLSIPNFWLGTMLLLVVSLWFKWLMPPVGFVSFRDDPLTSLHTLLLPAIALGTALAAFVTRMTRSTVLEVMRQDYIRTARAKGVAEPVILYGHALKNAFIPVLTVIGLQVGYLLGGAVIVEEIFSFPGVGRFLLNGIYQRDYPVVQGAVLFVAVVFSFTNLLVDVAYAWIDPRIRY